MNNYFANYKCWNDKKQRVAVFGKETGYGINNPTPATKGVSL